MATTIYVDTGATGAGTGVDVANAFTSLLAAINSLPASLSTPTTIDCRASTGVADTTSISQTPFDMTTSVTNYLLIRGNNRTGKYQTAAPYYRMEVTNPAAGAIYNNLPSHLRIDAVQMKVSVSAGSLVGFKTVNGNQTAGDIDCRITNCICWGVVTGGTLIGFTTRYPANGGDGRTVVANCLAIDCTTGFNNDWGRGIGHEFADSSTAQTTPGEYYNCTAAGCGYAFNGDFDMLVVNCLATATVNIGFVGAFSAESDYNAEDDGNGHPGTHSWFRTGATAFGFVNAAADDFHITTSDPGAKGFGTANPSTLFGTSRFLDDIDGQTRATPWDIGMDQNANGIVTAAARIASGYRTRYSNRYRIR